MTFKATITKCMLLLSVALLAACGGGGGSGNGGSNNGGGGNNTPQPQPVSVTPMVVGGNTFSFALKTNGTVFAWGDQQNGTLGNGRDVRSDTRVPEQVLNLSGITKIAAGGAHGLALRNDGVVFAWGANGSGQLGIGQNGGASATPVQVLGLTNITAIAAAGNFSLALRSDNVVFAWGNNAAGQLGFGDVIFRLSPEQIPNLTDVVAIATGTEHSFAIRSDATVLAWGNNQDGQLGLGDLALHRVPTQVTALNGLGIKQLAAGDFHSLARAENGTIRAWGSNVRGQVGTSDGFNNVSTPVLVPVLVDGLSSATEITARELYSMARLSDGTIRTWGNNSVGQLGNDDSGASTSTFVPQIPNISTVTSIGAGKDHWLAILSNGSVGCAGDNFLSECGRFEATDVFSTPLEVGPGFSVN